MRNALLLALLVAPLALEAAAQEASGEAAPVDRPAPEARADTLFPGRLAVGASLLAIPNVAPGLSARAYAHPLVVDLNVNGFYSANRFRREGGVEYDGLAADLAVMLPVRRRRGLVPGSYTTNSFGLGVAYERLTAEGRDAETIVGLGLASSGGLIVGGGAELFLDSQFGVNLIRPSDDLDLFFGDLNDLYTRIRGGLRVFLLPTR